MKPDQKHSPKYWVVHDKQTDDVFLSSAHKSKHVSERLFLEQMSKMFTNPSYDDLYEAFENDEDYECILVEIKKVEVWCIT